MLFWKETCFFVYYWVAPISACVLKSGCLTRVWLTHSWLVSCASLWAAARSGGNMFHSLVFCQSQLTSEPLTCFSNSLMIKLWSAPRPNMEIQFLWKMSQWSILEFARGSKLGAHSSWLAGMLKTWHILIWLDISRQIFRGGGDQMSDYSARSNSDCWIDQSPM